MEEELKRLIEELERKVEIEDWWYAFDIAREIEDKILRRIREVI